MSRDFFSNKWVLGGIVFLIVFSVACVFWYRYDTAPYRKSAAKTDEIIRKWDATQKVRTDNVKKTNTDTVIKGSMQTSEKPKTENNDDAIVDFTSPSNTNSNLTKQNQDVEKGKEVRVSPHGFGPYPEIPDGAPLNPFTGDESKFIEMLMRVIIKKWNEGERFTGASFHNGRLYLNYPNTIYIQYGEPIENGDGTITRPIISAGGSKSAFISEEQMRKGKLPSNLRVLEFNKSGIDPYEYLNLQPVN